MTKFNNRSFTVNATDKRAQKNYEQNFDRIFGSRASRQIPIDSSDNVVIGSRDEAVDGTNAERGAWSKPEGGR